jgi:hypothetical protein
MKTEEIDGFSGRQIWKSMIEYYGEHKGSRGNPYYRINEMNDTHYLLRLDLDNPDSKKYTIMKQSDDFEELYKEGRKLEDKIGQKYRELDLHHGPGGKILIEKLKAAGVFDKS